jgi:uncharacterized cupredoxin-like copper-binding protein
MGNGAVQIRARGIVCRPRTGLLRPVAAVLPPHQKKVLVSSRAVVRIAITLLAVVAAACGKSSHAGMDMNQGSSKTSSRTVSVDMVDIGFKPQQMTARRGETVKFVFHNLGKVKHEALFGDAAAQDAREKEMTHMGSSGHSTMMNEVDPGSSRTISYTFDKVGTTLIGCHETGHYAAGMKITITVS